MAEVANVVASGDASCSNTQLRFRWHHHQRSVVDLLDHLWQNQQLVDVTLAADGRSINVHRVVLCASSDYFQDILTDKDHEDKHAIVILKDVEFADLQALVHYLYKGEVRINQSQLSSFISTAKSLGIRGLMREDEVKVRESNQRKRRRSDSEVDSCNEDLFSTDEELSIASTAPPPPPLKHKTSLSKSVSDCKKETQNPANDVQQQQSHHTNMILQAPNYSHPLYHPTHHPHPQHTTHHHHHHHHHPSSTIETVKSTELTSDLDANGLGLFPCPGDPGPSRSSEDDSNIHHQSGNDWPVALPAISTVGTAAATNSSGGNASPSIDNECDNSSHGGHMVATDAGSLYSLLLQTYGNGGSGHVTQPTDGSNDSLRLEDEESDVTATAKSSGHFSRIAAQAIIPSKRAASRRNASNPSRNRPLFSCNRCGRIYSKKHSVLRHLRYECGVEPQFSCSVCSQRFKHRSDQQRHQRKIHHFDASHLDEEATQSSVQLTPSVPTLSQNASNQ